MIQKAFSRLEVKQILGVSDSTIAKYEQDGYLRYFRLPSGQHGEPGHKRYTRESIERNFPGALDKENPSRS